jgi:hypothetical protein
VPSLETAGRIDASDKVSALHAAAYRYDARVREIELQFKAKMAELRDAYLREVAEIQSDEAACPFEGWPTGQLTKRQVEPGPARGVGPPSRHVPAISLALHPRCDHSVKDSK